MATITKCEAEDCTLNEDGKCTAEEITINDAAECDQQTY